MSAGLSAHELDTAARLLCLRNYAKSALPLIMMEYFPT
jgi:hypothetical protein